MTRHEHKYSCRSCGSTFTGIRVEIEVAVWDHFDTKHPEVTDSLARTLRIERIW
jgi:hypothetical protein